jgi:hypothetical protein
VRASDAQRNPLRCRNQFRSTAPHIGKNLGSNSGLPQEAEGESDHLPETAKELPVGVKPCLSGLGSRMEGIVPCESV